MKMKKRFMSMLLVLSMCITLAVPLTVSATEVTVTDEPMISEWAFSDLFRGEYYGIIPQYWAEEDITNSINHPEFRILLAKLRHKILDTDCAVQARSENPRLAHDVTVEDAVKALYIELSNYDFTVEDKLVDLGMVGVDPVQYMKAIGVFTGKNGEQSLDEMCSYEQALVMTTRLITFLYDELDVDSKGFLWEVNSGDNKAYLLGSIHMASTDIYPFSQTMYNAFEESDALVLEADLFNLSGMFEAMELQYYDDGSTLKDHISPELYETVVEIYAGLGASEEIVSLFKPWALGFELSNLATTNTEGGEDINAALGIDLHFTTLAYLIEKPIYEIEGIYKQYTIMNSFSPDLQELILYSGVYSLLMKDDMDSEEETISANEMVSQWLQCWSEGDIERFRELYMPEFDNAVIELDDESLELFDEEDLKAINNLQEEFKDKLLTKRDVGMADYIDQLLQAEGSNTYFIIVGSGHYISDYSVLDILEEMGYELKQIK